jgi:hypothetical protein
MVLYVDASGAASLTGPVATIAHLRRVAVQPVSVRHVMQQGTEGT